MKIIDYKEEFGEVVYPEGFREQLIGKSIEEQADCFCISGQICRPCKMCLISFLKVRSRRKEHISLPI